MIGSQDQLGARNPARFLECASSLAFWQRRLKPSPAPLAPPAKAVEDYRTSSRWRDGLATVNFANVRPTPQTNTASPKPASARPLSTSYAGNNTGSATRRRNLCDAHLRTRPVRCIRVAFAIRPMPLPPAPATPMFSSAPADSNGPSPCCPKKIEYAYC
jgi:hypothetical protein